MDEQMNNKYYLLALNRIPLIGPRTIEKLLTRWPNLQELFQQSQAQLVKEGLPERLANPIAAFNFKAVDADLRWEEKPRHAILTCDDPRYPAILKEIYDPPAVLYAQGDLTSFQQRPLAIVGTRKPTIIGCETAYRFAFELAQRNVTIVSGLALGIDAQAHLGCLAAKGKTIAVLGTGIDHIYPRQHLHLADKICQNGLLLSEFPLKSMPIAGHFPRRNRIISGLSLATMIVEAAIRSGSLITARLALEQNRDVLAIPGSIQNPLAKGCHYLLQQGAKLVTSVDDVLHELNMDVKQITAEKRIDALACEAENLVKCIGFETTTIDQIIARSGLIMQTVVCSLADLELQGVIKAVPGGYTRCSL
jgi:DNA processing protein